MQEDREIRSLRGEISKQEDGRFVEGYAALFDTWSNDLGGFIEKIDRGAFTKALLSSDVLCVLNHNTDRGVLARCSFGVGSLTLEEDEKGLRYSFEAPSTELGKELLQGLKRGDIRESSFAFTIEKDEWDFSDEKIAKRTIKEVKALYDVSPVYFPAYNGTFVSKRMQEAREEEEKRAKAREAEAPTDDYYNQFKF